MFSRPRATFHWNAKVVRRHGKGSHDACVVGNGCSVNGGSCRGKGTGH